MMIILGKLVAGADTAANWDSYCLIAATVQLLAYAANHVLPFTYAAGTTCLGRLYCYAIGPPSVASTSIIASQH